ncbi:uncharacterized protein LOC115749719 [Rhodamnia argentea]|uniref:Uncharacterized protein LOC115749719 n=1 Tax=Rhodamnia argentea TaxID=178133 RepID=A0A8B8Q5Z5_9MYRT|nr:uncharacterized protein LOC115749719 [Rhodamnia argentea]
MSQLRNAIRSTFALRSSVATARGLPPLLRDVPRPFSTEPEQPAQPEDSSADPFLRPPNTGLVYAKLFGVSRHTLKTDIVNLLEGCNLTQDDVRFHYNRMFVPTGMMVQFPSRFEFDQAFKVIGKKGRLYRLERADRSQWDLLMNYGGKALLLQGIPFSATPNDVERFLSGCQYEASSIQMMVRPAFPDPIKMATVSFPSQIEATNAFITKNRGFCQNSQVLLRVLQ